MTGRIDRAREVLVVAPHPDDETIGAWALMRRLRLRGARIQVFVVSDGGASHPRSRTWPPPRLIAERRRETLRAMRRAGVPASAVSFLGWPDGELETRSDLRRGLLRRIGRGPPPCLIVGPSLQDAHADHRAVAAALAAWPRKGELRLSYRVWPEARSRFGAWHIALTAQERQMKRQAILSYRTQTGGITDSATGFAMTHRHVRAFAGPREHFEVSR